MKKYTVLLFVLTSIVLVLSFCFPLISLHNFTMIEREEVLEDVFQARKILQSELMQLSTTADDYSGWDDTYAFIGDRNPKYIHSSLGEAFYYKLRLNVFCLIDKNGDIVLGRAYDYKKKTKHPIPASLLTHLTPASPLLKHPTPESTLTGFLSLPEGLLMVVSHPILTSEYRGPVRGTLIMGRFLDHTEILRIGRLAEFDMDVLNAASAGDNQAFRRILGTLPGKDKAHVLAESEKEIAGYSRLLDIYGKTAGLIRLNKPRIIYLQAKQATWRFIMLYGTFYILVAIAFILINRKLVIVHRNDRQAKKNLLAFVELAVDAIFSVDQHGMIVGVNTKACEITGYDSSELQAMSFLKLIDTDGSEHHQIWEEPLKEGKTVELECTITRKDGLPLPVDIRCKQMPDGTFQCFMRDISERKKMEGNLLARQRQINAMAFDLSIAEERERCRIAGELHDQVGPTLLLAKMKLNALKAETPPGEDEGGFEAIEELLQQSVQDIISLTFQLRPPILANAGLEAALKWLAQEFGQKYALQVEFVDDMSAKPLKYEIRSVLFQTVRELLLNVSKHAGTRHAVIGTKREADMIVVTVDDDGTGFQVEKNADGSFKTSGFGIFNIQNKIEFIGGRLTIDSSPGKGTHVAILVPLEASNNTGVQA